MKPPTYRDQDYAFGQSMLSLRSAVGLTQARLAAALGVSRQSVAEWEAGTKYPKANHLKSLLALAVQHHAFPASHEAEAIRGLWQASHQKVHLDEAWLAALVAPQPGAAVQTIAPAPASGLPTRAAGSALYSLPFQPTPFVGRDSELAEFARILGDPACRLLTLIGPGGIGKTRLGIEAARRQTEAFADGVTFVALAPLNLPHQIVSAVGESLNMSFAGQRDPTAHLLENLRDKQLLLVLDNFEHLLEGADLVQALLQRAPSVKLLVTSRERLNLQAEWLFDVEGLPYPANDEPGPTAEAGYGALDLFVQRARQVLPTFQATPSTLPAIVRICQRVAGMPLAIELAAAGVRTLPIGEIDSQIRSNLDGLQTSMRDVPARHRSLRAVFEHTWSLLSAADGALFSRLAVFRGGCSAAAAEQVAGATLPTLQTLVDKSLLRVRKPEARPNANPDAPNSPVEPRFVLLESLREYALEKLAAQGEAESLRRAHALYYLTLAEAAAAQSSAKGADVSAVFLKLELDNLHSALQWACDSGHGLIGLRLTEALWRHWGNFGYVNEGRAWLAQLLAMPVDPADPSAIPARRRALNAAAWMASDQHEYALAASLFEQTAPLRRALGEPDDEIGLFINAARQSRYAGQYQRATALLEGVLERGTAPTGPGHKLTTAEQGQVRRELGLLLREQGKYERASAMFDQALQLYQSADNRTGIALVSLGLADVARDQGDGAGVRRYAEPSLALLRELDIHWAIGFALNTLALGALAEGDLARAAALIDESLALFRGPREDTRLTEVLVTQGRIHRAQGKTTEAYAALSEAVRLGLDVGPLQFVPTALDGLASLLGESGQAYLGVRLLGAAYALRGQMGTQVLPLDQPAVERAQAMARSSLGAEAFAAGWADGLARPLEQILSALPDDIQFAASLASAAPGEASIGGVPRAAGPQLDWGDAIDVPVFYGREADLALLSRWVVEERCRLVSILGMGGIGKSALAATLMQRLAAQFEVVIWRSLRDVPPCEALVDECLKVLTPAAPRDPADTLEGRLRRLLASLRERRVLLVLDNLEMLLEEGTDSGRMRAGAEGYALLLRQIGGTSHQSCLLLTSREKPTDLAPLEGSRAPVRALRLAGLSAAAGAHLLAERDVAGSPDDRTRLVEVYQGNPLALKIAAQAIVELFGGAIAPFLEQGEVVFGGVRELLREQFDRLSALERDVFYWLAILREPASQEELLAVLSPARPPAQVLEALDGLRRRSLIERGQRVGSFTLQSVVLEYATGRLIVEASREIEQGRLDCLSAYGLCQAQAKEYVREVQAHLLVLPLLTRLQSAYQGQAALEARCLALLATLRGLPQTSQGYGPANLVALVRLLRGDLRGLDLSGLALRGVSLHHIEMQDANLSGAVLQDSVFTEPFDAISAVATSQDGQYWAAASRRGEVWVWTAAGRTLHRVWQASSANVAALTFSPDGRQLVTGGWDSMVKLWDVAGGKLLWEGWHAGGVISVAFAPDGRLLASGGNDALIQLWDPLSGASVTQLSAQGGRVCSLAWSPAGRLLASGCADGSIWVWEPNAPEPGRQVRRLSEHTDLVTGLAFAPDGAQLASASFDGTVRLWDAERFECLQTFSEHTDRAMRVAWSPDGRTLASCSFDHTIWLWDAKEGRSRTILRGHRAAIYSIAFTPDSRNLLSGSYDGTLQVWDVESGQRIRMIVGYAASLFDLDWGPDGRYLASGGADTLVTLWDSAGAKAPRVLRGHRLVVQGVAWSPDGRLLASGAYDGVGVWDPVTGVCLQVLRDLDSVDTIFQCVAWSPDGRRLACGSYLRGVQVWEMPGRTRRWVGRTPPTLIRRVAWSPDGAGLVAAGDDGYVYRWDATDGTQLLRLAGHHGPVMSVAWSHDGTRLASAGVGREGGELFVWEAASGKRVHALTGHPDAALEVAWSPSGDRLVSGGGDGKLRWWEIGSGQCVRVREAHQGAVQALKVSPDGRRLASCGDDGAILLWDLHSGEPLQTLRRDRPYERLNISGIRGLTEAQKGSLRALGAIELAGN